MILIVDDRPENIFSLKTLLESNDFCVDTAASGEEALKKILQQYYSLIILDVQMPGIDGFEVAEAISGYSKAKDTPIIFLSAVNTEKRFITKGYSSGGIDYVTKPIDTDIFMLKVKTFYKLSEQNRELMRMHKSLRDEIESRKKTQQQLDLRINELRTVLESLPQIAFTITAEGELEYVNELWFKFSKSPDVFPKVHPDDDFLCDEWLMYFAQGKEFVCEIRIKELASNIYRYYLLRIIPIKQGSTITKWVGTFTDIHEQKQVNEILEQKVKDRTRELIQKNIQLENSNHELQQFAWVASHDLKEPLRKIQTFGCLIRDKYLKENNEGKSYIDRIVKSSERMSALIFDLLNYSRLSIETTFQKTNLNTIITNILVDLEVIIQEKNAVIKIAQMPEIEVEPTQFRQVFQNLISNALKFTHAHIYPEISITAEVVESKNIDAKKNDHGEYCRIVVKDNGIGFDEKYLDKVFTIFQRLNDRNLYEGTGIGMAIAKKIIDKHNGIITARSKENEGASFIMILPLKQPAFISRPQPTNI